MLVDGQYYFRDGCDEMGASLYVLMVMHAARVFFEIFSIRKLFRTSTMEAPFGIRASDGLIG